MSRSSGTAHRIWTAPLLIGLATLIALIVALLDDGLWDRLAALLLFAVLAYAVALGFRPAGRQSTRGDKTNARP